jgi:hypothetical protein
MDQIDRTAPSPEVVFTGPLPEAELMRAVLEGSGIECLVWEAGLEQTYGAGIMPSRVVVPPDHAERAREIIAAARAGDLDLDLDEASDAELVRSTFEGHASSDPIAEVTPWWRHPELPALLSAARVVLVLGAIVGIAYLVFTAVAD